MAKNDIKPVRMGKFTQINASDTEAVMNSHKAIRDPDDVDKDTAPIGYGIGSYDMNKSATFGNDANSD